MNKKSCVKDTLFEIVISNNCKYNFNNFFKNMYNERIN